MSFLEGRQGQYIKPFDALFPHEKKELAEKASVKVYFPDGSSRGDWIELRYGDVRIVHIIKNGSKEGEPSVDGILFVTPPGAISIPMRQTRRGTEFLTISEERFFTGKKSTPQAHAAFEAFPQGFMKPRIDKTLEDTALRELQEETGYTKKAGTPLIHLSRRYLDPVFTPTLVDTYLVEVDERQRSKDLEETEYITNTRWVTFDELTEIVNLIGDRRTISATFDLESYLGRNVVFHQERKDRISLPPIATWGSSPEVLTFEELPPHEYQPEEVYMKAKVYFSDKSSRGDWIKIKDINRAGEIVHVMHQGKGKDDPFLDQFEVHLPSAAVAITMRKTPQGPFQFITKQDEWFVSENNIIYNSEKAFGFLEGFMDTSKDRNPLDTAKRTLQEGIGYEPKLKDIHVFGSKLRHQTYSPSSVTPFLFEVDYEQSVLNPLPGNLRWRNWFNLEQLVKTQGHHTTNADFFQLGSYLRKRNLVPPRF